jgi:hypothetical protein
MTLFSQSRPLYDLPYDVLTYIVQFGSSHARVLLLACGACTHAAVKTGPCYFVYFSNFFFRYPFFYFCVEEIEEQV